MKVYIVCTFHPICFIQHANPLILSFNVKSKVTKDMLLVILPELVDSEHKARPGKMWEWISFVNLSFLFFCLCILSFVCLPSLFPLPSISSAASSYSSPFCSCNLNRWSESSLLVLKVISIWCAQVYDFWSLLFCRVL